MKALCKVDVDFLIEMANGILDGTVVGDKGAVWLKDINAMGLYTIAKGIAGIVYDDKDKGCKYNPPELRKLKKRLLRKGILKDDKDRIDGK